MIQANHGSVSFQRQVRDDSHNNPIGSRHCKTSIARSGKGVRPAIDRIECLLDLNGVRVDDAQLAINASDANLLAIGTPCQRQRFDGETCEPNKPSDRRLPQSNGSVGIGRRDRSIFLECLDA